MSSKAMFLGACLLSLVGSRAAAQSPRVLYTWAGTGNTQMWIQNFSASGSPVTTLENTTAGELTVTETGGAGENVAISDDFNLLVEGKGELGGVDLTNMSAIEFDFGHNGTDPITVQFFVQATPGNTFIALGPDQIIPAGAVATYSAPLTDLTPDQIAYVRTVGINIADHADQGDLVYTLREVRTVGTALTQRDFLTFEAGTAEGGLQGAFVDFEGTSVENHDLNQQNQSGLIANMTAPPTGNTGSLEWVDLDFADDGTGNVVQQNGAAISFGNGTAWAGNAFNERGTDMSNYSKIVVRMAATNVVEGAVTSLGVQYYLHVNSYHFHQAGAIQQIPADGEFHELTFDLTSVPDLDVISVHGINLMRHSGGDLIIDIDNIRAVSAEQITDCNKNKIDDERDLLNGTSKDCNGNRVPDECDISGSKSPDCNGNAIPDECEIVGGPITRVLYTWAGTDNLRGWAKEFPDEASVDAQNINDGEVTFTETSPVPGVHFGFSDDANITSESGKANGGLDLTGMTTLEFDLGHDGGDITVQFYVEATPAFTYSTLADVSMPAGDVATYSVSIASLTPAQITHIRRIGFQAFDHQGVGNATWTIQEVRAKGTPPAQRDYGTYEPGSSDAGLQGAYVSFNNAAVEGNDGMQNQTGLTQKTTAPPAGNTGSLHWTDLAGQGGGAISWVNGTLFGGNTFNERPTDMSNYTEVVMRLAATNVTAGAVASVDVQFFLQTTDSYTYQTGGPDQALPADGAFHELTFPIDTVLDRGDVVAQGIRLQEHATGDLVMDIDNIRAVARTATPNDCNSNRIPDECEIGDGRLHDNNHNGTPDECEPSAPQFHRGDSDNNGKLELTDAVRTLGVLFLGVGVLPCRDAADADDNGKLELTDAVRVLGVLFLGVGQIPSPGPPPAACGADPTPEDVGTDLGCETYTNC